MSNSTKNELIHEATRLLLEKGLHGFSLQELAISIRIKKPSIFHHFSSKKLLLIELFKFHQKEFLVWTDGQIHLTPSKQLNAYANEIQNLSPLGVNWSQCDLEIKLEITSLLILHKKWLTEVFKNMSKSKKLNLSIADSVDSTISLLQGSIQMARINNDPKIVRKNLKSLLKILME